MRALVALGLLGLGAFLVFGRRVFAFGPVPNTSTGNVSSPFGPRTSPISGKPGCHRGIDLPRATGTPVVAVEPGRAVFAGDSPTAGKHVVVVHDTGQWRGWTTYYFHLSRLDVTSGTPVDAGQQIGAVGATGRVTGPHLHMEVRDPDGDPVDPGPFLGLGAGRGEC